MLKVTAIRRQSGKVVVTFNDGTCYISTDPATIRDYQTFNDRIREVRDEVVDRESFLAHERK